MAKPIKETPVLKGKDAKRFVEAMQTSSTRRITTDEKSKMLESFHKIKAISHF